MVKKLAKSGQDILISLTPEKCEILHFCFGLMTEVGELCDSVKKHVFYEQPLDRENMIEEGGDTEFYMSGLRQILDIARSTMLQANMAKLAKRYPNYEYNNKRAEERADKQIPIIRDMLD